MIMTKNDDDDDVTFIWMILMKMIDMRMAMMHMRTRMTMLTTLLMMKAEVVTDQENSDPAQTNAGSPPQSGDEKIKVRG